MATPAEIADSLTLEEIPVKLRCATCNKVAQDAVRLPCCDQNICIDCQENKLEAICPICYHEPLDAAGCTPNKALRQTIKVFLKKKAIDRGNARKQEAVQKAATLPAATQEATEPSSNVQGSDEIAAQAAKGIDRESSETARPGTGAEGIPHKEFQDIPQPSVESPGKQSTPRRASTITVDNERHNEAAREDPGSTEQRAAKSTQQKQGNPMTQGNNGMHFDPSLMANVGFNGVGDPNQMMQMMQNGMINPMMGGFQNMMGMPGMGMDPVAMQAMFSNFGGPGMMNGMHMGMGFDAGQGAFGGGFNGQPHGAWNSGGQNDFNQNGYGAFGAGYNMAQHQGNFNQMHQPIYPKNDFHQHGYHNQGFHRGRGRGRGFYPSSTRGRGNYHQVNQNFHANNTSTSLEVPQGPVRRGSPEYTPMNGENAGPACNEDQAPTPLRDDFAPGDADDCAEDKVASRSKSNQTLGALIPKEEVSETADKAGASQSQDQEPALKQETNSNHDSPPNSDSAASHKLEVVDKPAPPLPLSSMPPPASPSIPTGPSGRISTGRAAVHVGPDLGGTLQSRGSSKTLIDDKSPAVENPQADASVKFSSEPKGLGVVGAPTGPKAMRQPPPSHVDTGFSIVGRAAAARANTDGNLQSPRDTGSRSRSPSKHRPSRHNHRQRSGSPSGAHGDDKRKDRHRRHRNKYDEDFEKEAAYRKAKPSHRSHRDRDYKAEKDRDTGRHSRRGHKEFDRDDEDHYRKSGRQYSRSPSPEMKINGAGKSHKSQHRSRDKDDDHHVSLSSSKRRSRDEYEEDMNDGEHRRRQHRHSKRSKHAAHTDAEDAESTGRNGLEKHQSSSSAHRPSERADQLGPLSPTVPTGPKADFHALEREKRDRERQMKELQRRALAGNSGPGSSRRASETGSRRPSDGGGDDGGGIRISGAAARKGGGSRKISVKYEDELDDLRR